MSLTPKIIYTIEGTGAYVGQGEWDIVDNNGDDLTYIRKDLADPLRDSLDELLLAVAPLAVVPAPTLIKAREALDKYEGDE